MSKIISKQAELTPDELKSYLTHVIDNNIYLQERGQAPTAVEIIGESGIKSN